jgi:AraC-like DNA-binding protein
MWSRLINVRNWTELAEAAHYSAKRLATECGVSLRQLERYLSRVAGRTPQRWLTELRQKKSIELLWSGHSIKEVSYQLGYKQASHFSRDFKRFYGVAPSEVLAADSVLRRRAIQRVALRLDLSDFDALPERARAAGMERSNAAGRKHREA